MQQDRLFYYLVGEGEHSRRHGEAERLGSLEVEHELELGGLHYGQVGRLFTLENATRVKSDLSERPLSDWLHNL
jgi:hypothetical protein